MVQDPLSGLGPEPTRAPAVPAGPVSPAAPVRAGNDASPFDGLFQKYETEYGLPPGLLKAVAHTESRFNPQAVSRTGARGLMQFMPATAKQYGVADPFDPEQSVAGAARYLTYLGKMFGGDIPTAVAAYNAGEGNVQSRKAEKFPETLAYVPQVMSAWDRYRQSGGAPGAVPAPAADPVIGFNGKQVFSAGQTFDITHGTLLDEADKAGFFKQNNAQLPPGFRPIPASMLLAHLGRMRENRTMGNTVGEIGDQMLSGGGANLASMVNKTGAAFSPAGSGAEQMFNDNAASWQQKAPVPDTLGRGTIAKGFIEAAPNVVPTVAGMGAALINPIAGGAAVATMFGGAQFTDTYNKMIAAGKPASEAFGLAMQTGAVQGAGEAVADVVGGRMMFGAANLLRGMGGKSVEGAVKAATDPRFLARFGAAVLGNSVVQSGTEFAQDAVTTGLENRAGVNADDPIATGLHSAEIAAYMSVLLAPFGGPGQISAAHKRAALGRALEDQSLSPGARADVAAAVASEIAPSVGVDKAKAWLAAYTDAMTKSQQIAPDTAVNLMGPPTPTEPRQIETRQRTGEQQAAADLLTLPRQEFTQQPALPGMPDTAGFPATPEMPDNLGPSPEGQRMLDMADLALQGGDQANAKQLIEQANAPETMVQRDQRMATEGQQAAKEKAEQDYWAARDVNTTPLPKQGALDLQQRAVAPTEQGPFGKVKVVGAKGRPLAEGTRIKNYIATGKEWLISNAGLSKKRWDEGVEFLVPHVPKKWRTRVRDGLLADATYQGLAEPTETNLDAKAALDLVRDTARSKTKLTKAQVQAFSAALHKADGEFATIHELTNDWDKAKRNFARADSAVKTNEHADARRNAADALNAQFAALEEQFGTNNIDAAIEADKAAVEKGGGSSQGREATRLSIAWKQYKTNELMNEGLRGTTIRENKPGEKQRSTEKEFATKIERWMASYQPMHKDAERVESDDTDASRLESLLYNLEQRSNKMLTPVLAKVLRSAIGRNNFAPKIEISRDPSPGKLRAYGTYNHGTNTVTLYAGGHNEQILLHELIHGLTVKYIYEHAGKKDGKVAKLESVLNDVAAQPVPGKEYAKEHSLTDTDMEQLNLAIKSTTDAWKNAKTQKEKANALAEFVTYGMTQPQFQEWMKSVQLSTQAGIGSFANETYVVDGQKKKDGTLGKRTKPTIWTRFRMAVSQILTGKSWANRDNSAMSHFIDQTSTLLRDLNKSEYNVTPAKSAKGVSHAEKLQVVTQEDVPQQFPEGMKYAVDGGALGTLAWFKTAQEARAWIDEEVAAFPNDVSKAAAPESTVTPEAAAARQQRDADEKAEQEKRAAAAKASEKLQAEISKETFERVQAEADTKTSEFSGQARGWTTPLGVMDSVFKAAFDVTGASKGLKAVWNAAAKGSEYLADKYPAYRTALHKVVDSYGKSERFTDALRLLQSRHAADVTKLNAFSRAFGDTYAALPMDQQAAITAALHNEGNLDEVMKQFTPEQRTVTKTAMDAMKQIMDEAVGAGLFTKEQVEAEGFAMLKRVYASALTKNARSTGLKTSKGVLGLSQGQTGMKATVPNERVTDATAKRHIEVVHVRPDGRVESYFVPEGTPLSAVNDGANVEFVDGKPKWTMQKATGDKQATFYRPYSAEEQQAAGAISDPRYLVQVTMHQLINDVANARLFQWMLGSNEGAKSAKDRMVFDTKQEAIDSDRTSAVNARNWKQVPNSKNAAGGFTFGALHNKWIPEGIWNDLNARVQNKPLFEGWDRIMGYWKKTKTAWSPVTHFNNVMSSFAMAYYADIPAGAIARSMRIYNDHLFGEGDTKARADATLREFDRSGADIGSFSANEVSRDLLRKMLQQMAVAPKNAEGKDAKLLQVLGWWETAKAKVNKVGDAGVYVYQLEDNVFRLAAYIEGISRGMTPLQAGKFATESMVDYNITAPLISGLRSSVLPFIAWPYRMIPMMIKTAFFKPWKMATLTTAIMGLNALAAGIAGGDPDEERKFLPSYRKGNLGFLPVPKTLRLPWNTNGKPTYMDISSLLPLGDLMQNDGVRLFGLPLPSTVTPGGPAMVAFETAFGYDLFRDQKVDKPGASVAETVAGRAKHLAQQSLPNLPLPLTRQGDKVWDMLRDKHNITGGEMSNYITLLGLIGPKLVALDEREGRAQQAFEIKRMQRDYRSAISMAVRGEARYGTPDWEATQKRVKTLVERMIEDINEVQGKDDE